MGVATIEGYDAFPQGDSGIIYARQGTMQTAGNPAAPTLYLLKVLKYKEPISREVVDSTLDVIREVILDCVSPFASEVLTDHAASSLKKLSLETDPRFIEDIIKKGEHASMFLTSRSHCSEKRTMPLTLDLRYAAVPYALIGENEAEKGFAAYNRIMNSPTTFDKDTEARISFVRLNVAEGLPERSNIDFLISVGSHYSDIFDVYPLEFDRRFTQEAIDTFYNSFSDLDVRDLADSSERLLKESVTALLHTAITSIPTNIDLIPQDIETTLQRLFPGTRIMTEEEIINEILRQEPKDPKDWN